MKVEEVIAHFEANRSEINRDGMSRYGIKVDQAFGMSMVELRSLAKTIGKDHQLALDLWETGFHESRLLSTIIDVPSKVTEEQMEHWVSGFDSWDVCDQCCSNLFSRTPFATRKAKEWVRRDEEYVKRAGFVLMAALAVHDKKAADGLFLDFLLTIDSDVADDDRPFVRKAVNWALRQIGKRNVRLQEAAISTAESVRSRGTKSARWIAADALRELQSEKTTAMVKKRKASKIE
ncbi:MAG: DNA alkylation repair protein [Methanomassiliicoccales archaeon]|jgi:3-methyladenine DNA glycosylase AlkD